MSISLSSKNSNESAGSKHAFGLIKICSNAVSLCTVFDLDHHWITVNQAYATN